MLIKDDINKIQYAVILDGVILYKSSVQSLAENYKDNLTPEARAKAIVEAVTPEGKQILFG